MTSEVEIIREHTVLERLPVTEVTIVEVVHDGPQGPAGNIGNSLPVLLNFMRITTDGHLQIFNSDQNTYHTILVQGDAGAEYITIGTGEV